MVLRLVAFIPRTGHMLWIPHQELPRHGTLRMHETHPMVFMRLSLMSLPASSMLLKLCHTLLLADFSQQRPRCEIYVQRKHAENKEQAQNIDT